VYVLLHEQEDLACYINVCSLTKAKMRVANMVYVIGLGVAITLPEVLIINIVVLPRQKPRRLNNFDFPAFCNSMICNSIYGSKAFVRQ